MSSSTGLIALGLFSAAFLSAVRWSPWLRLAGGLARAHRTHHVLGFFTLVGILIHIGATLFPVPRGAWGALLDPRAPPMLTALLALAFFGAALGGVFASLTHPTWIRIHWLFGLSFALAGFHAMALARYPILVLALLGAGGFGILVLITWHLFPGAKGHLEVAEVQRSGNLTYSLLLRPHGVDSNRFRAGRVVYVRFLEGPFTRSWHPFSVASCRIAKEIRLVVKSLGRDTCHLQDLKPGSRVDFHGPYEELSLPEGCDQVWIAGGIGIAPFLGMAHCLGLKTPSRIRLFHYSRPQEALFYADELDRVTAEFVDFRWQRIDVPADKLPDIAPVVKSAAGLRSPYFLMSGPPKFMRYARRRLRKSGVPRRHIITEEFLPW